MNFARAFAYTRELEEQLDDAGEQVRLVENQLLLIGEELACARSVAAAAEARSLELNAQRNADILRHRNETKDLWREIRSLRRTNANLVDRRAIREGIIPPSESLTREKPSPEEETERSKTVDSVRRSGPVAKTRQEAEAKYLKELEEAEASAT